MLSDTESFICNVAQKQGWKVNWDSELRKMRNHKLLQNFSRYGYFLCPSRESRGSRPKDQDIICPCAFAHADIKKYGHCYCGLYLEPNFWTFHLSVKSIPDRGTLIHDFIETANSIYREYNLL